MLYYTFKNYEEFKELFGIVKHGNGNESRKNRILLSFLKDRRLLHEAAVSGDYTLLHISDMATLKNLVTQGIIRSGDANRSLPYVIDLMGKRYYSSIYSTDDNKGLCEDGDTKAVRYISMENGERVFKMKAGKFYRHLILETDFGKALPQQVVTYLCEEFATEWQSYTMGKLPKNKLYVNRDFKRIYSSEACEGDFGSCMVDREHHDFYLYSVNASAAYLEDENGKVISRCILYNEVRDEEGKVWRLAERQYASEENEILKRALVEALIAGNYIDGYKKVGAGCGDARAFVDIHGNSLAAKRFSIDCTLGWDDTLSYQDSFKWYDMRTQKADNYGNGEWGLDTTSICLEDESSYDDYHDYSCRETTRVYVEGREYYCDTGNLEDFIWVEREEEYHHEDDVQKCPECGEYFVTARGRYSDITEETYCDDECRKDAESVYKQENWYYSDYDEEYYESEDEITTYYEWNSGLCEYEERSISKDSLLQLLRDGKVYEFENTFFNEIDPDMNLPYGYQLIKKVA